LWTEIISGAYAFLGREIPTGERLKFAMRTFDDLCDEIPTAVLRTVYRLSMSVHDERGLPFWDGRLLLKVWNENAAELRQQLSKGLLKTKPRVNCPDCFGNSTGRKFRLSSSGIRELVNEICTHENDPGDYPGHFEEID